MKNVLVMQSGGPTAAINATVAGVVERAMISDKVDKIYGSLYGIKGVIEDNIMEIGSTLSSPMEISRLIHTPGAALGSCRHKLPNSDGDGKNEYETIVKRLQDYNIGYMVCIGGNDSMDTVNKLSAYIKEKEIHGISVMGAPKTIDNDLNCMDHSPGFASAARYISTVFSEIWSDCHVYDIPAVTIVEVMGRHTGWLTASASIAADYGKGPDLIYLPESSFDNERFVNDVKLAISKHPAVIIAVSEGIKYADGRFVAEAFSSGQKDAFGHTRLSGAAKALESLVGNEIGCKVRSVELNIPQRASANLTSAVDLIESRMLGSVALDRAISGISGQVAVLERISNSPYRIKYSTADVNEVANVEKYFPKEWINAESNFVTEEALEYFRPLIAHEGQERFDGSYPSYLHFVK